MPFKRGDGTNTHDPLYLNPLLNYYASAPIYEAIPISIFWTQKQIKTCIVGCDHLFFLFFFFLFSYFWLLF